jgi:membrane-bound serine protease (ClpP class)
MLRRARLLIWCALALVGVGLQLGTALGQDEEAPLVYSIELTGTIDPATESWVKTALDDAESAGVELAIIRLDTPGGLVDSTREIVKTITAAPMPVVVYVSPDGARAASAGVYLAEAADVAAMAPQTNIGSATPVQIAPGETDEVLGRKIENDAAAYMRALAEVHGRNGKLAAETVTEARNLTAEEALRANLIDAIAGDEEELLTELDGFEVKGPKAQRLETAGATIDSREMPFQYELLQIVVNPNVSFLLLLVGLAGLGIELLSPGLILPGTLGLISFLLGLYGSTQLPVTVVGILLLVAAVALIIAEAHLPTGGVLGAAGVASLIGSGLLLYDTGSEALEVDVPVIVTVAVLLGVLALFVTSRVVRAQRQPRVMTGWEELIGAEGEVRVALDPVGQVFVEGALWRARPASGEGPVEPRTRVRVAEVDGLTLLVEPVTSAPRSGERAGEAEPAGPPPRV